ncbi:hypothetical protein FACS1894191_6090 [Clostridia bacterium]|nr:hypothetical protein FACS1894191_6090 [Clostridia bacterium]
MPDKLSGPKSIPSMGGNSSGHSGHINRRAAVPAGQGAAQSRDPASRDAVNAAFSLSKNAAAQHELQAFLNMLEESNRKIGEESAGISRETGTVPVPDLLGLSVAAAAARLKSAGLTVSRVLQQAHPQVQPGCVMNQLPPSGALVVTGSGVRLIVCKNK